VEVQGEEKSWGPDYLKFGLDFASDAHQTRFNASVSHRAPWINSLGAEWRNDLQAGFRDRFASEFMQPLSFRSGAFVAPRFEWRNEPKVFFLQQRQVGTVEVQTARAHLDAGLQNKFGELRVGAFRGRLKSKEDFGVVRVFDNEDVTQAGYTVSAIVDQIDSPGFPQSGLLLRMQLFATERDWGSDDEYTKAEVFALGARSSGRHALQLAGYYGETVHGNLAAYDPFYLGGFLRGSGYRMDELIGTGVRLARAVYTYRLSSLPTQIGRGLYFGGSLETTRATLGTDVGGNKVTRHSMSLFLGADTIFGTAYLALGQGLSEDRPRTVYLLLGSP
jgi:NTE family protein